MSKRLYVGMSGEAETISYDFGALVADWAAATKVLTVRVSGPSTVILETFAWSYPTPTTARATYTPTGTEFTRSGSHRFRGELVIDGVTRHLISWTDMVLAN